MAARKAGIGAALESAALQLYFERGDLKITAAEIADRAGTTERTFFRHFANRLDAFFGDEQRLRDLVVGAIRDCSAAVSGLGAAVTGFLVLADDFELHREAIRERARIVAAHNELQERELQRQAPWATAIRGVLVERRLSVTEASAAASWSLVIFRAAYERWLGTEPGGTLADEVFASLATAQHETSLALRALLRQPPWSQDGPP